MKKWLIGLLLVVCTLVLIVAISSWRLKQFTRNSFSRSAAMAPFDAVIVPGLPYDSAHDNVLMKVRMLWAKELFDKGITKNIIFSGAAVHSPWIEGEVMKIIADSLGIPSAHTFAENTAEHGNENVYYSYEMAKRLGFTKVALATDLYQNSFLASFIEKRLPQVAMLPVTSDSFPVYGQRHLPQIDARAAFVKKFVPLKLRESRWQRLKASFSDEVKEKK